MLWSTSRFLGHQPLSPCSLRVPPFPCCLPGPRREEDYTPTISDNHMHSSPAESPLCLPENMMHLQLRRHMSTFALSVPFLEKYPSNLQVFDFLSAILQLLAAQTMWQQIKRVVLTTTTTTKKTKWKHRRRVDPGVLCCLKGGEPNALDHRSIQPLHPLCGICKLTNDTLGAAGTQANHKIAANRWAALLANQ